MIHVYFCITVSFIKCQNKLHIKNKFELLLTEEDHNLMARDLKQAEKQEFCRWHFSYENYFDDKRNLKIPFSSFDWQNVTTRRLVTMTVAWISYNLLYLYLHSWSCYGCIDCMYVYIYIWVSVCASVFEQVCVWE